MHKMNDRTSQSLGTYSNNLTTQPKYRRLSSMAITLGSFRFCKHTYRYVTVVPLYCWLHFMKYQAGNDMTTY